MEREELPESPELRRRAASEKLWRIWKLHKELPECLAWDLMPAIQDTAWATQLEWRKANAELGGDPEGSWEPWSDGVIADWRRL